MIYKFFILLFPALTLAGINVDIRAATKESDAFVHAVGTIIEDLTYEERGSFGIQDNDLKTLIQKFYGKYPTHAYLKKPGGPHKLFEVNKWRPTTRVLHPVSSRVIGIKTNPVIQARQRFGNTSTKSKGTYTATITQTVENTVSNSWSKSKTISVGQKIEYGVSFEVFSLGGSTEYSFDASWGSETKEEEKVTVGTTTGVSVELNPGEIIIAELSATRGTMEAEVEYEAFVIGTVAIDYENPYKGGHFHNLHINDLLLFNGKPLSVKRKETIKVGFYADAFVNIRNLETNDLKANQSVPITNASPEGSGNV